MRAIIEKVVPSVESSFNLEVRDDPCFEFEWHFHPEYELTLILESAGRRFVGDSIDDYRAGDLVLIGPDLPHTWYSTADRERPGRHRAIVVLFAEAFLGAGFFARPEFLDVGRMLKRSAVGLCFDGGPEREAAAREIAGMPRLREVDRLLALLAALARLARCAEARPLASSLFVPALDRANQRRIDAACTYINQHLAEKISLDEMARLTHMSPSAFSHFFRRTVGKTFIDYVNEIRIGHACRLLIEGDRPITQVAHASGFSNLSNFNRRFLRLKGMTPRAYRGQTLLRPRSDQGRGEL